MRLVPVGQEDFFRRLWRGGRLRYRQEPLVDGGISELSARILATAIRRRQSLFVVLPPNISNQAPALFATALVLDSLNKRMAQDRRSQKVVMFGTSVSMRSNLSNLTIQGLSLADVFRQVHLESNARRASKSKDEFGELFQEYFPEVVSAFSPASAKEVLRRYKPSWIAADCDGATRLEWLPELLQSAESEGIPVIGWATGQLSYGARTLRSSPVPAFCWPLQDGKLVPPKSRAAALTAEQLLSGIPHSTIRPLVVSGGLSERLANLLGGARAHLVKGGGTTATGLVSDTARAGWGYLRALESLHVPLKFYEAECRQYWGMRTLSSRREAFARFSDAIGMNPPSSRDAFHAARSMLEQAHELLEQSHPPTWDSLLKISVSDASATRPSKLVFTGQARRKLFELALLSFEGISSSDLDSVSVSLDSLDGNASLPSDNKSDATSRATGDLYLVGWPSPERYQGLQGVIGHTPISVLCLPHQEMEVLRKIDGLTKDLAIANSEVASSLKLVGVSTGATNGNLGLSAISLGQSVFVDAVQSTAVRPPSADGKVWEQPDPILEAQFVLAINDDDEDAVAQGSLLEAEELGIGPADDGDSLVVETAVRIGLEDSRSLVLAKDSMLITLRGTGAYEATKERAATEMRVGDRIVFIHGQRRQSLYAMLIERVHAHPAMTLHISLIRSWHEEVSRAYGLWSRSKGRNYADLLREVRAKGCERTSPLTVRFWVTGEITCPSDPEDLRRMAEVLDIDFIKQHYRRVSRAADRLRGLHRGLANRLGNWLRSHIAGNPTTEDDVVFDEELGLTFKDFRSSLEVLTVTSIKEVQGPFLRSSLGRIGRL